jgi:predicted Zn-dependent protease
MVEARAHFFAAADRLTALTRDGEVFLLSFLGEDSGFARLNHNRIRQAGQVRQREARVTLIRGRRNAEGACSLAGEAGIDQARLQQLIGELRQQLDWVENDPHLHYATEVASSEDIRESSLPESQHAQARLMEKAEGLDLVGIWANGQVYRGFANSLGQRNWFSAGSFNLDWSLCLPGGQAVKCGYAGRAWDEAALDQHLDQARGHLRLLANPRREVKPGRHRVYLAPRALGELLGLLDWGGFGLKSHKTRQTPLLKMIQDGKRLHPAVTLEEHHADGFSPRFTPAGFIKPEAVTLIAEGGYRDCLADPRSAAEYGAAVNADVESTQSLVMNPGDIPEQAVLERLGTGIYISNLWYCNYSDRSQCRFTGMTRFACFWVEDGQLQAPIPVLRFDESLYHLLGEGLIGLTRERELILDSATYGGRSTASMRLPGVLVRDFNFVM